MKVTSRRALSVLRHRAQIVGIALLCVAGCSQALTLGRVRGVALVGQALNIVVPVQLDASEDAASQCFDAEVFHADTRQAANQVRVRVEATPQAQTADVRILSSAAIDEPVVTVYLRAGCTQKTTRRYVLLADMPSEAAAPPLVALPSPPATVPLLNAPATSRAAPAAAFTPTTPRARPPARGSATARQRATQKEKAAPAPAQGKRPQDGHQAARPAGQPRLKLDPLEFFSDRIANLAAPAPATLPEDALRNIQRMQTLEGSVKTLMASAALNEASLADLKVRLQKAEKAESERFPGMLVYGLIALLLACLAALAWLWQRQRGRPSHDDPWWSDSLAPAAEPLPESALSASSPAAAEPSQEAEPASVLDVDLMDLSDSRFAAFLPAQEAEPVLTAAPNEPSPEPQATPTRQRHFGSMLDILIRQQAEFLVSLGQADQAVQILRQHLDDSATPNPFVYLDLLGLLHLLDQKSEFQQLRETFNQTFNGKAAEFEFFTDQGQDLEAYPELVTRISALWPTPDVLALIDDCLFADLRQGQALSLDLAAFRDLLLLRAVALNLVPGSELDLDLSDSTAADPAFMPASAPDVSPADNPAPLGSGNLIEFDLPGTAPALAPGGQDSGSLPDRR